MSDDPFTDPFSERPSETASPLAADPFAGERHVHHVNCLTAIKLGDNCAYLGRMLCCMNGCPSC